MRVGIALPQYSIDVGGAAPPWPAVLEVTRKAAAARLDSVWLSDHPFAVGPDGVTSGALEPLVAAAALLRSVPGMRVGTLVLAPTMRAAGLVAHVARTASGREPGRLVVGVGAGWSEPEHRVFGLRLPPYGDRVAALEATVDALRAIGDRRPRVLCGGSGDAVLDVASRRADAWNVAWDLPPEGFRALSAKLDAACDRNARDPRSLSRSAGLTVLVAENERGLDRAVERLRARAAFLRDIDRQTLTTRIVCGTPDVCAERIAAYGADEVVAALLLRDDLEMLDLFGERVAPLLR